MYFPYLRGKQFELLAIRELLERNLITDKIIPIIEPIKLSTTLLKTVDMFIEKQRDITIIHNPQVGSFTKDLNKLQESDLKDRYLENLQRDGVFIGHLINKDSQEQIEEVFTSGITSEWILAINHNKKYISKNVEIFGENVPKMTLIPDDGSSRRKVRGDKVLLADRFTKLERNTDYAEVSEEFFSDDHLYYEEEGFKGFADYSVIGSSFSESGFAPYAVAIHIVYFDSDDTLMIKHFVSDSNEDIKDPANKFYEALEKLIAWKRNVGINTFALEEFEKYYGMGTYPGLGTVKKLSMMHHLELMSRYLSGEK